MNQNINLKLSHDEFCKLFSCLKFVLYKKMDQCEEIGDDPAECESIREIASIYAKFLHIQNATTKK